MKSQNILLTRNQNILLIKYNETRISMNLNGFNPLYKTILHDNESITLYDLAYPLLAKE